MSARTRVTQDPLQEEAAALARKASGIELDGVVKTYPGGIRAVDDVSMNIAPGEFVVLVGPSGCGKSTLLRMIAGLEQVDGGCIRIAGRDVTSIPSRQRDIAMVFQDYALYPHMNVRDNLAFGLKLRRTPKPEIRRRVDSVARTLGLQQLFARRPGALSGGQRQRVAIGRAMVREPAAFLMDEPLSNLDAKLRVAMRGELARLHERLGITTVFVTHDQVEAMTLGQRVAVLRDGVIQQVDRPQELFLRPANLFVAAFIGSPSMNLVEAKVVRGSAYFAEHVVSLPDRYADVPDGSNVILGIRPTDLMHACDAPSDHSRLRVTADLVEEQGAETYVLFSVDAPAVSAEAVRAAADVEQPDDDRLLVDDRARFTVKLDSRRQVVSGDVLELAVDSERMHLFDPETGATVDQLWRGDTSTSKPRSSA